MLQSPGRTRSTGGSGCSTTGLASPALDVDALPSDVVAGVGDQETNHVGHVLGRAHAAERHGLVELANVLDAHCTLHQPAPHLGVDQAGGHDVDADAVALLL